MRIEVLIGAPVRPALIACQPRKNFWYAPRPSEGQPEESPLRSLLFVIAVTAACASGPIPAGPKPIWVQAPSSDLRFSPDKFICAVGTTSVGSKPAPELLAGADAAARAAVAAVLQSAVASEASSSEAMAKQVAKDFDLTAAVNVLEKWREGDTAYAWGVLDKSKALALQQGKVAEREKLAKDLLAQGETSESAAAPIDALRAYAKARTEAEAALGGVMLLRALGGKMDASSAVADADGKISALLGKLVLTVVEGDKQRAVEGKALAQPIVFTAWIAGKRAAGLPFAIAVPGGRADASVTVSPEGRAEVRVADIGKFVAPEQPIAIHLDWPKLLGVPADKAPAWAAAVPKAGITAVALKKGVETTRVLVLIYEKIDGSAPVNEPPVAPAVASALQRAGFNVQDAKPIVDRFGAERLAGLSDAQVKEAAKNRADVVVIGTVTSRFASNYGATTVWHRARADVRAIDVGSGQIIFRSPADEVKSEQPGEPNVAGRSALEAVGKTLAPGVEKALRAAAGP
jgi:hypothetical protein